MPGIRLSSPLCRKPANSSAGGADYADRHGITFGSTCTCDGVPEPRVPPDEGRIIGQTNSVSGGATTLIASRNASACRARSAGSVSARCSKLRSVILEQNQTGADTNWQYRVPALPQDDKQRPLRHRSSQGRGRREVRWHLRAAHQYRPQPARRHALLQAALDG